MSARKRELINSPSSLAKRLQTKNDVLQPKMALTEREMFFFNLVVSSRESESFGPNDLIIASQLAKTYRRIEDLNELLDEQGFVQVNEKGTQISNPVFVALTQCQGQVQSATRVLGLSASQRALTGVNQKGRNEADSRAREILDRVSADDLL